MHNRNEFSENPDKYEGFDDLFPNADRPHEIQKINDQIINAINNLDPEK